jgi:hypothetical protein
MRGFEDLILSQHFTVVAVVFLVVHLVNGHAIGLRGDVAHLIAFFGFVVHGALAFVSAAILTLAVGVEEDAQTGDADAAEDTENVALVFVKLGWCFAAEHEEVVAQKGLDASETEVGEARAIVQESVDALVQSVEFSGYRKRQVYVQQESDWCNS